jgi:pimeloyl-ACP methyl ester carboxylesterase
VTINTAGSFTIQVQNGSGTTLSNGATLTVNPAAPSISNISPTTVTAGTFSLTINGSNFNTSNAQIVVTGPNCPTTTSCVVPNGVLTTKTGNQLVGPVTINTAGSFTIQVQNGSGTTLSNGATLTVNPAAPSISNISPTTVTAGTFSLTINGSNFNTSNAQIVVTGPNCPTTTSCVVPNGVLTTKTSNQLVGPVTINTAGSFTIQVQNGSGTTLSNGATLTVNPAAPSISNISPTTVTAGTFSLTINGSNFNTSNAQIVVTGPNCPTTTSCVVPNGVLTTKTSNQLVGPVTINTAGSFTIQVQNGSGTTLSNGATLTVNNAAAPSISNISPTTVTAGTFSLTINGSNFNTSNAQIVVTGPNCPTSTSCVVPNGVLTTKTSNQLVGPVTINTAGSFTIQVQNGSGTTLSNGATLTVQGATQPPSIGSISPGTPQSNAIDQNVTVFGANFQQGLTVTVTFPGGGTALLSGTQVQSVTPSSFVMRILLGAAGNWTIRVNNPDGGQSNVFNFTVQSVVQAPVIYSLNPATPFVNPNDQDVFVSGANFQQNLTVTVNFPGGSSILSGAQIQNLTPSSFVMRITLGATGNWSIRVNNPDGGQSSFFGFSVATGTQNPSIGSINPSAPTTQGADQNVIVNGNNFQDGLRVDVTFPSGGVSTLQGTGQIQNVTANSFLMRITLNAAGNWTMRVINPSGAQSGQFSFNVQASTPAPSGLPTAVLSPVIGPLRVTSTNLHINDGKWEFNQHKTGLHSPTGGISSSNDTFAWDINLYTPTSGNADAGKPVFAVTDGQVVSYVGLSPGSGPGAVLVAHPNAQNPLWFSGYLHMTHVKVSLNQMVNTSTVLGEISRVGVDNDHLHLVFYSGQNSRGNLQSFNATILERSSVTNQPEISSIVPDTVNQSTDAQLITINGNNFQADSIIEVQSPTGESFAIAPDASSSAVTTKLTHMLSVTTNAITARVPFASDGPYAISVINTSTGSTSNNRPVTAVAASTRTPVILIPGVMGSKLNRFENGVVGEELWPGGQLINHKVLKDNVEDPSNYRELLQRKVVATELIRDVYGSNIYGQLIDFLKRDLGYTVYSERPSVFSCDESQKKADLFLFPYDWRNSNWTSARDLFNFVQCIAHIRFGNNPIPPTFKVDIIAHSMGGLVARRYILNNPGTHHVDRMVTLGTPWLGAPKTINTMEFGGNFEKMSAIILPSTIQQIAPYLKGVQELIPSQVYVDQLTDDNNPDLDKRVYHPLGEDGWNDFDGDPAQTHRNDFGFDRLKATMNKRYANSPGDVTDVFHSQKLQDDWRGDNTGVTYYNFIGRSTGTPGSFTAKRMWTETGFINFFAVTETRGDGTVPEASAKRMGRQDFSGIPSNRIRPFNTDHIGLVSSAIAYLHIACVINTPNPDSCLGPPPNSALSLNATTSADTHYNLVILNSPAVIIADSFGNTVDPLSTTPTKELETVKTTITGDTSLNATFPLDQNYHVTLRVTANPISIVITKIEGEITVQAIRYLNVILPANVLASFDITPDGVTALKYDGNGDGIFETVVNPTVSVTGLPAQDVEAPVLAANETFQNGLSQITLQATDAGTGVDRIMYSTNGTTYQLYTGPFALNPTQTPIVYAFADDKVANRSGIFTYTLTGSSTIPLELLLNESSQTSAALDSVLFVRDPFKVVDPANLLNTNVDRNTRLVIFVTNLQLGAGDPSSSVVVNLVDSNGIGYDIPAEDVRPVANVPFSQVIFRLPSNLPSGVAMVRIRTQDRLSNAGTISIVK